MSAEPRLREQDLAVYASARLQVETHCTVYVSRAPHIE